MDDSQCPFDMLSGGDLAKLPVVKRRNRQLIRSAVIALRKFAHSPLLRLWKTEDGEMMVGLTMNLDARVDLIRAYIETIRIRWKWRHSDFHLYQSAVAG